MHPQQADGIDTIVTNKGTIPKPEDAGKLA
jgi:hypothetical protein